MLEIRGGAVTMLIESKTFQPVKHGLDQLWLAAWLTDALPDMHSRMLAIAETMETTILARCYKQARRIAKEVNSDG